jgi:hypothetical protein
MDYLMEQTSSSLFEKAKELEKDLGKRNEVRYQIS